MPFQLFLNLLDLLLCFSFVFEIVSTPHSQSVQPNATGSAAEGLGHRLASLDRTTKHQDIVFDRIWSCDNDTPNTSALKNMKKRAELICDIMWCFFVMCCLPRQLKTFKKNIRELLLTSIALIGLRKAATGQSVHHPKKRPHATLSLSKPVHFQHEHTHKYAYLIWTYLYLNIFEIDGQNI